MNDQINNNNTNNNNNNNIQQQQPTPQQRVNYSQFEIKNKVFSIGNDKVLLLLKENEIIYFHGLVQVRTIIGSVDVYGYTINSSNQYYQIYSPFCSPALSISPNKDNNNNNNNSSNNNEIQIKQILNNEINNIKIPDLVLSKLKENQNSISNYSIHSLIVLRRLDDTCENPKMFIKKRMEVIEEFKSIKGFHPLYSPDFSTQPLIIPNQWLQLINTQFIYNNQFNSNLSILTCGERNVGKSTFNRILINKLLKKYTNLVYIDTDTGQSEFTPCGLLSIDIISSPLLGPPFTHCKLNPLKTYFFGDTSPKNNPEYFLNLCFQLIECFKIIRSQYPTIPVILNTNGWLKSLGLHLTQEIIKYFNPSVIVQLYNQSINQNNNINNNNNNISNNDQLYNSSNNNINNNNNNSIDNNSIDNNKNNNNSLDNDNNNFNIVLNNSNQYNSNITFTQQDIDQLFDSSSSSSSSSSSGCNNIPKLYSIFSFNYFNQIQFNNSKPAYNLGSFDIRNLMFKRYFKTESCSLTHQIPYQVSWKSLKVKILNNHVPPSQIMYSLNGSIIGICIDPTEYNVTSFKVSNKLPTIINKDIQLSECIGLGLIRSIDMLNGYYYIITPIDHELLQNANVILRGSIDVPPTLTISLSSKGTIVVPYLQLDVLSSYGTGSDVMDRPKNFI